MKNPLSITYTPAESVAAVRPVRRGRYFFVGMAILFFIIAVIGFTPSYQGVSNGSLKLHWFAHAHGAVMTSWLVLFLAQSVLAARGNLKYHRKLGQFGFALGILVFLVMATASTRARLSLYIPVDNELWDILLVEFSSMSLFGLFFTWGMLVRKNAVAHKRLLFLATMVLLQAAIDRTRWLPWMNLGVNFIYLDLLLIPLFIYDWLTLRRIYRVTLIGAAIIMVVQLSATLTWGSPAWHQFWYNRFAPFVEKPIQIRLNNKQIEPLVGNYGDKTWHMTVSREGDRLYLKLPNQPKWELGATADTTLFVKTMIWNLTVVKRTDGSVAKVINTQGPLVWEAAKLK